MKISDVPPNDTLAPKHPIAMIGNNRIIINAQAPIKII